MSGDMNAEPGATAPSPAGRRDLLRVWRFALHSAFVRRTRYAAAVFFSGLAATAAQLAAIGVVVALVSALQGDGRLTIDRLGIDVELNAPAAAGAVAAVIALMVLAALVQYGVGVLLARVRAKLFGAAMRDVLLIVRRRAERGTLAGLSSKEYARLLRRDARYASRIEAEIMDAPRPLATLIVLACGGLAASPGYTALLLAALAISAPAHVLVSRWGASVSETYLADAARKSRADQAVMRRAVDHADRDALNERAAAHYPDEGAPKQFLDSYARRARITAASGFVSNVANLIAIGVLATVLTVLYLRGAVDLTGLVALVLLYRLAGVAAAQIGAITAVVSAYAPFVAEFLDLREGTGMFTADAPAAGEAGPIQGRFIVISPPTNARALARDVASASGDPKPRHARVVASLWEPEEPGDAVLDALGFADDADLERLISAVPEAASHREAMGAFLETVRGAPAGVTVKAWSELDPGARFWLAGYRCLQSRSESLVLAPAAHFFALSEAEREAFEGASGARRLAAAYMAPPKRLPKAPKTPVFTMIGGALTAYGDVEAASAQLDEIRAALAAATAARTPGGLDTDDGEAEAL